MGFWSDLFGSDDDAEEAAWGEESGRNSSPVSNSDTSGNEPDDDD